MQQGHAPFFIVGSGRSGSTLLRMILASHSRIAIPPETWFVRLVVKQFPLDRGLSPAELDRALEIITSHYRWPDMDVNTDEYLAEVRALDRPHIRQVVESIYRRHLDEAGKSRWGDKTPGYIEVIPQLAKVFPGAKFIHLVRDGRDVVRSFRATGWYGPWLHSNAAEWLESLEYDEQWSRSPLAGCILTVRYEDLVLKTEECVQGICAFLGEEFEPQMLLWQTNVDRLVPSRELVIHEKLKNTPKASDVGRWKHDMSSREIFVCESFMGHHLARAGYERKFKSAFWAPVFAATRWYCRRVLPVVSLPIHGLRRVAASRKWWHNSRPATGPTERAS